MLFQLERKQIEISKVVNKINKMDIPSKPKLIFKLNNWIQVLPVINWNLDENRFNLNQKKTININNTLEKKKPIFFIRILLFLGIKKIIIGPSKSKKSNKLKIFILIEFIFNKWSKMLK